MLTEITPLILTFNEAPNIERTLERLTWARDVVVVDSFSDDQTLGLVSRFPNVRVYQRKFDSFAGQCNFGLTETGIATEWVLNLDADYVLTDELIAEVKALKPNDAIGGYRSRFIYCINGRRLRSGIYPPVTILFRRSQAYFRDDGHAHRVMVHGDTQNLHSPVLHDDRKSLSHWFGAQSRYTKLEANKLLTAPRNELSWTDRIRTWRLFAPPAMLFYCLILRGGVVDGWLGFYYAFQRSFAELMLSLYLLEHDLNETEFNQENKNRGVGSEPAVTSPVTKANL
ncbi:MAG TPA: glycosyltransferase family 2 protein [Pyrinomonadaceae bacterium]|nr:glycosyltransferase family 2 protein [Pyrinomonadaceae bacterium]